MSGEAHSIELARPDLPESLDVEQALNAIVLAANEVKAADQALALAQTEVEIANREFLADPTIERNGAVELAERKQHAVADKKQDAVEHLAETRKHYSNVAEQLLAAADRLKGEQDLDALGPARESGQRQIKVKVDQLDECINRASGIVAELESLVSHDHQICAAARDAQKRAQIPGTIRPIELDTLLRAAQISHSAGRPRRRSRKTHNPAMDLVLADLRRQSPPLTADEKAVVCVLALIEHARESDENPAYLWLIPAYHPLPQFLNSTAAASAHTRAIRLLDALKGEPQK